MLLAGKSCRESYIHRSTISVGMTLTACSPLVAFTPSATCEAAPGNITLLRGAKVIGSTPITGPVVVGVNQTVSIRCKAKTTKEPNTLKHLFWQYSNGTRIQPVVGAREMSDHDVFVERVAGHSGAPITVNWVRLLHFKRIFPSSAGIYVCVAVYERVSRRQSMEIQVSGVWMV